MLDQLHDEIDALETMRETLAERTRQRIANTLPELVGEALGGSDITAGDTDEARRQMAKTMALAVQEAMALAARDVEDVVVTDGTTEAFSLGARFAKERTHGV